MHLDPLQSRVVRPWVGIGQCRGAFGLERGERVDHRHVEGEWRSPLAQNHGPPLAVGHGCGQGR